jgi:hypothetical protein
MGMKEIKDEMAKLRCLPELLPEAAQSKGNRPRASAKAGKNISVIIWGSFY